MNLIYGLLLGALIGLISWRLHALTVSGAIAAMVTGGLIFGLGGLPWAVLLLVFFVSSSLLSKLFKQQKLAVDEKFSKGSRRDWGQVLANGGLGAVLALLLGLLPAESAFPWPELLFFMFAGAMAAVNADTWATELGVLSRHLPVLITTRKPVERGTSGGVTLTGTLSALCGALLVAGLGVVVALIDDPGALVPHPLAFLLVVTLAGLTGSLVDSFLGATVQSIYYCPRCQKETERFPVHLCGAATTPRRGWRWLNNDLVNFACSFAGAAAAAGLWLLF